MSCNCKQKANLKPSFWELRKQEVVSKEKPKRIRKKKEEEPVEEEPKEEE